jgi:hypothetical protein
MLQPLNDKVLQVPKWDKKIHVKGGEKKLLKLHHVMRRLSVLRGASIQYTLSFKKMLSH